MKTHQVFGISPDLREYTYVDRGELDNTLNKFLHRTTHIAVRGPSKSGKSWLRQKILSNPIIVQCRLKKPFIDIYVDALSQLNISLRIRESREGVLKGTITASGEGALALLVKAGIKLSIEGESKTSSETQIIGHDVNDLRFIADIIKASGRRLVIEDFHYMSIENRKQFAFDLKALWDYGVFVVIIGVWCESNLLLHLNPDLTGRVTEISLDWVKTDLKDIILKGGRVLNIIFSEPIIDKLAELAYSNAGILQQLALYTLDEAGIVEKHFLQQQVDGIGWIDAASMNYAEQLNPVYQQFAKRVSSGIRTKSNATGIYAHAMAVMLDATDEELVRGLNARTIYERATKRQNRIQLGNMKSILNKIQELQVDEDGRGLILGYDPSTEEVTIVDRQLLLYRRYSTVKWPWEDLIKEADTAGGMVDAG